jgi:hypothetical protein
MTILDRYIAAAGLSYAGMRMCEFGNQHLHEFATGPAKTYFKDLGVDHTSYDLNGEDGALAVDLAMPIGVSDPFDVVTNFGTCEHIPQIYTAFLNAHNLCRLGGLMVHAMPYVGHWPGHGFYTFTPEFFLKLAEAARYRVVGVEVNHIRGDPTTSQIVYAGLMRTENNAFIARDEFATLPITVSEYPEHDYPALTQLPLRYRSYRRWDDS